MVKWNIFGKSKSKKEDTEQYQENPQFNFESDISTEEDKNLQFEEEQVETEQPITEFHESLHTGKKTSKKGSSKNKYKGPTSDQRVWRDVKAIEENIDNMHVSKTIKPTTGFEKKVDQIIKDKEEK